MDFQSAITRLGNRESRKIQNNTYLEKLDDSRIGLRLHSTHVLVFHSDGWVELNSGGYHTVTTKSRLNCYLPNGLCIMQKKGVWTLGRVGHWQDPPLCGFKDHMKVRTIHDEVTVEGGDPVPEPKAGMKLRKRAKKYAHDFIEALVAGKVGAPDLGDCIYCSMREVETKRPLGECTQDQSHLLGHMDESYFVPSLLARAVEVFPISQVAKELLHGRWTGQVVEPYVVGIGFAQLEKALYRYVLRQLGQAS